MKLYRLGEARDPVIQELKEKRADQRRSRSCSATTAGAGRWCARRSPSQKAYSTTATKIARRDERSSTAKRPSSRRGRAVVLTRDGWIKRVRELKGPVPTVPPQTGRRRGAFVLGGSLREPGPDPATSEAYVTRFNDVPSETGYAIRSRSCSSSTTMSAVGALSLDPAFPGRKSSGISRSGTGCASRWRLTRGLHQGGRRFARPAKEDELTVWSPGRQGFLAVVTENAYPLSPSQGVNELAGPVAGSA